MQPGYPNQPMSGAGYGGYSAHPGVGTTQNYGAPPNPSMYNGGGDVTYVSFLATRLLSTVSCLTRCLPD